MDHIQFGQSIPFASKGVQKPAIQLNTPPRVPSQPDSLKADVFFGRRQTTVQPYRHPQSMDLVNRLVQQGISRKTKNKAAVVVSQHFSEDGKTHRYSYRQLLEESQRMATAFKKLGLNGKRVAMAETNSIQAISSYYGALAAGATVVPLNLLALQDENTKMAKLTHMIGGAQSDALVVGADPLVRPMAEFQKLIKLKNTPLVRKSIQRFAQGKSPRTPLDLIIHRKLNAAIDQKAQAKLMELSAKGIEVDTADIKTQERSNLQTLLAGLPKHLQIITPQAQSRFVKNGFEMPLAHMLKHPDPNQLSEIIFTSGTSGNPKGVGLTHQNLVFTTNSLSKGIEDVLDKNDVMLLGLPLFHIFGKAVLLTGVNMSIPMVMLPSLSNAMANLDKVAQTIADQNVTVLPAVPVFLEKLAAQAKTDANAKKALSNIRLIISGGAPLKKETYEAWKAINPNILIVEGYGSSEGGVNLMNKTGEHGYVGTPLPGVEMKMIENAPGHAMAGFSKSIGEGEILVRSPGVAQYIESTLPAGQSGKLTDAKGFYHTGDQGRRLNVLKEGQKAGEFASVTPGPMQIIGRESNFIKDAGGERRDPSEFEAAVKQANAGILDAMAIPYKPDRETEKSVVIAVTTDTSITEESLKKTMSRQVKSGKLAGALIPKHIIVLNRAALPKAFQNDFKREAGYKVARDFVAKVVAQGLVQLQDKTANSREKTVVEQASTLNDFAEQYRYLGK